MGRILLALAAAVTAALTGFGALAAAPAQAADGTTITDPAAGATVKAGTDTVTVQFGSSDYYEVDVEGTGPATRGYSWTDAYEAQAGETQTFTVDPLRAEGAYEVTVYDGSYDVVATSSFDVAAPPMRITSPSARPATFYPVVRDGYQDSTRVAYTLNRRADMTAQVFRVADGKRVRATDFGFQRGGRRSWTWNGKTDAGQPVGAGRYRIEIDAQAPDGTSDAIRTTVTATTATLTRHATRAVNGNRASSTSHRGNCYTNRDSYLGELDLDCWAGNYAQATYTFAIPANAQHLAWRVGGEQHCCDQGRITRTGTRVSARAFRVLVRVTNWRAFTVNRVSVSYSYQDRI